MLGYWRLQMESSVWRFQTGMLTERAIPLLQQKVHLCSVDRLWADYSHIACQLASSKDPIGSSVQCVARHSAASHHLFGSNPRTNFWSCCSSFWDSCCKNLLSGSGLVANGSGALQWNTTSSCNCWSTNHCSSIQLGAREVLLMCCWGCIAQRFGQSWEPEFACSGHASVPRQVYAGESHRPPHPSFRSHVSRKRDSPGTYVWITKFCHEHKISNNTRRIYQL